MSRASLKMRTNLASLVALTIKELDDKIANMRGAVMMAYPMGLPEWDSIKLVLDSVDGLDGTGLSKSVVDFEHASLWVAGKEFVKVSER